MKLHYQPTYTVKKEHRVVICTLQCSISDHARMVYQNPFIIQLFKKNDIDLVNGGFTVKAISKCDIADIFNPQFGKQLAFKRAKYKAFKKFIKFYNSLMDAVEKELSKNEKELGLYLDRMTATAEAIESLTLSKL